MDVNSVPAQTLHTTRVDIESIWKVVKSRGYLLELQSSTDFSGFCFWPWSLGYAAAPFRFAAGLRLSNTKKWYTSWHFICRLRDASHFVAFDWNLFGLLGPQFYVSSLRRRLRLRLLRFLLWSHLAGALRLLSSSMGHKAYMWLPDAEMLENHRAEGLLFV